MKGKQRMWSSLKIYFSFHLQLKSLEEQFFKTLRLTASYHSLIIFFPRTVKRKIGRRDSICGTKHTAKLRQSFRLFPTLSMSLRSIRLKLFWNCGL